MREYHTETTLFQVALRAVMLLAFVFLSGCASRGTRHEASLYPDNKPYRVTQFRVPAPVPAVRGYRRRLNNLEQNDERRYAAIYGVPPRKDYLDTATGQDPGPLPPMTPASTGQERQNPDSRQFRRIIVTRGDTLYNIAWRYKVSMSAILKVNNLRHSNLEVGQELLVPVIR